MPLPLARWLALVWQRPLVLQRALVLPLVLATWLALTLTQDLEVVLMLRLLMEVGLARPPYPPPERRRAAASELPQEPVRAPAPML